jgi:HD-GYP domain-containing protein (c-di-GMP phosphodiesterase class II)
MRVMRTHARRGHDILAAIGDERMTRVATVVLHHHEAVDGSGYPEGLKGESIPITSRILSIADAYDAIATVRPYHRPRGHDDIMQILHEGEDRKYDAHVLATFARIIACSAYKAGTH